MTDAQDVADTLTRRLAWWGGASVAGGGLAAILGRTPGMRAFGWQTAGWGAIDLAIAGISASRSTPVVVSKLRKTLWINTGLDLVYVAAGAHLVYHRPTFGRRITGEESAGHGAAIVVQGAALLVLDSVHARRLGSEPFGG